MIKIKIFCSIVALAFATCKEKQIRTIVDEEPVSCVEDWALEIKNNPICEESVLLKHFKIDKVKQDLHVENYVRNVIVDSKGKLQL